MVLHEVSCYWSLVTHNAVNFRLCAGSAVNFHQIWPSSFTELAYSHGKLNFDFFLTLAKILFVGVRNKKNKMSKYWHYAGCVALL